MKFLIKLLIKLLIILVTVLLLFALGDSVFNGLFHNDGYRPVTEQMREVITGSE